MDHTSICNYYVHKNCYLATFMYIKVVYIHFSVAVYKKLYYKNNKDGGVPIEIKSSTNTASKSLTAFIEKYDPPFALKFSTRNINTSNNKMKCYPIYMLMFIRDMDKLL